MDRELFESMRKAIKIERSGRGITRPIYTPCCLSGSTLRGQPAPQYHCNQCGKVYTTLAVFVTKAFGLQ